MPPAGLNPAAIHAALDAAFPALGDALYEWMAVDHPVWARQAARQAEAGRKWCAKLDQQQDEPPH